MPWQRVRHYLDRFEFCYNGHYVALEPGYRGLPKLRLLEQGRACWLFLVKSWKKYGAEHPRGMFTLRDLVRWLWIHPHQFMMRVYHLFMRTLNDFKNALARWYCFVYRNDVASWSAILLWRCLIASGCFKPTELMRVRESSFWWWKISRQSIARLNGANRNNCVLEEMVYLLWNQLEPVSFPSVCSRRPVAVIQQRGIKFAWFKELIGVVPRHCHGQSRKPDTKFAEFNAIQMILLKDSELFTNGLKQSDTSA